MYTIFDTVATYPPWMAEGRAAEISLQDPEDDVNTSVVSKKVQTGSQFPQPPTTRRTYTTRINSVVLCLVLSKMETTMFSPDS